MFFSFYFNPFKALFNWEEEARILLLNWHNKT